MAKNDENLLKFHTPASWWGEKWREGLFLGNGTIGANVYGGVSDERILLNNSKLSWMGRTYVVPDISTSLDEVRGDIEDGEFLRAQKVLPDALKERNFRPQSAHPLPLCKLGIHFDIDKTAENYSRVLDMDKGEARVYYTLGDTAFERDAFVSRDNDTICYRITKKGSEYINVQFSFSLMHRVNARTYEGICNMPEGVEVKAEKQMLYFSARNDEDGRDFGAVAHIKSMGGAIRCEDGVVYVTNAQSVFVIVKTFVGSIRTREWEKLKVEISAIKDSYDKLLHAHHLLHAKLYNASKLSIGSEDKDYIEDLMLGTETKCLSAELVEKYYNYAKYLFVASSNSNNNLLTQCSLWNGSYFPYRAMQSFSGEMELMYLFALQSNLYDSLDDTFSYFESHLGDYRNNAQRLFGCKGIVVPVVAAPNTGRLGSNDVFAVYFTGCAAWVCNLYYKYVKLSHNTKFLKQRLMPFMVETALFYQNYFVATKYGLESNPSVLSMRVFDSYKVSDRPVVAKNSTLDFALARDLFSNIIEASRELEINKDKIEIWEKFKNNIPKNQLSSDGTLREFVNSVISMDYTGVSNGTLYSAYFGDDVNFLSSDSVKATYLATANSKLEKLSMQNSFNMVVLGAVYARLCNADKAKQCLSNAIVGCSMNNLAFVDKDWRGMGVCGSGVWTPVQTNVNIAFANTVQQMLMYSNEEVIKLFPALPSDWTTVSFERFVSASGISVSCELDLKNGKMTLSLESSDDRTVKVYLPSFVKKMVGAKRLKDNVMDVTLLEDKKVSFTFICNKVK